MIKNGLKMFSKITNSSQLIPTLLTTSYGSVSIIQLLDIELKLIDPNPFIMESLMRISA